MSQARDTRGPRAADRRKAKLDDMRYWYPHFTEAERIRVVDMDEWPGWMKGGRRHTGEGWYE